MYNILYSLEFTFPSLFLGSQNFWIKQKGKSDTKNKNNIFIWHQNQDGKWSFTNRDNFRDWLVDTVLLFESLASLHGWIANKKLNNMHYKKNGLQIMTDHVRTCRRFLLRMSYLLNGISKEYYR